jgi:hypothetical protein
MRVQACHKETEVTLDTTTAVLCTRTTVVGQRITEGTLQRMETNLVKCFSLGTNSMTTTAPATAAIHWLCGLGIRTKSVFWYSSGYAQSAQSAPTRLRRVRELCATVPRWWLRSSRGVPWLRGDGPKLATGAVDGTTTGARSRGGDAL